MAIDRKVKTVGYLVSFVAVLAIVTILSIYFVYVDSALSPPSAEVWAQFGDFFGGTLNPFLAFLSLLAIIAALIVQARELSLSTEALRDQSKHLQIQAFENTFFSLIAMHNENVRTLDLEDTEETSFTGRAVFKKLVERLRTSYENEKRLSRSADEIEIMKGAYQRFYAKHQRFIGHYLRAIHRTIQFVENRCPENNREFWLIIRAQLSVYELILIFYHSLCHKSFTELDQLKKFEFFEHMPAEELLNKESHRTLI